MVLKNQIAIPKPCHQDWQSMTPLEKGRFCDSCKKEVYDFTKASDREILNTFDQNKKVCGRFNVSQLERELIVHKEKNKIWTIAATGVIVFLGLGGDNVNAQVDIRVEQTDIKNSDKENVGSPSATNKIFGTVTYNSTAQPLPGVSIAIKGNDIKSVTDFDGNYSIGAEENDTLVFTYVGFETVEIKVGEAKELNIILQESILGESIIMVGGAFIRRTFFGRIFHKIGNLFR